MRSRLLVAVAVLGSVGSTLAAAEKAPVRVGILGMDNYQAIEYVRSYNDPKAEGDLAGVHVSAVYPVTSESYPESAVLTDRWLKQMMATEERRKSVEGAAPLVEVVNSVDELLKRCDAVMIWSLDGRNHLEQAKAVLKAKKPLFIGRPMAANAEDAVEIFRIAAENKTACWTCSQHRFSPGFIGMRNHPEVGKVIGCDVYGGFDMKGAPADEFIRPLHSIETLYTIMGPGVVKLSCVSTPTAELVTAVWKDGRVGTYRGIKQGAVKYSATVFGDTGVSISGIYGHGVPVKGVAPTNDKYMGYGGLAIEMAKFFKGAPMPVSPEETLEIYSFMKAMETSRAQNGAIVELPNLAAGLKR